MRYQVSAPPFVLVLRNSSTHRQEEATLVALQGFLEPDSGDLHDGLLQLLEGLDARSFGDAACILGAGRVSTDSIIDPSVGIELLKKVGQAVQPNEAIARIHYQGLDQLEAAEARLEKAIKLSLKKPIVSSLIIDRISHEN